MGLLVLGVFLRFAVSTRGHNFDVDSYLIVDDIERHHGNVYAETSRYNYGPAWFLLIRGMGVVSGHDPATFRLVLVTLLVAVDIATWLVVRRRFGSAAGLVFFLNPIQIIICGYHNQFDTLAVLLALLSVLMLESSNVSQRRLLGALALIGLSLVVKHVVFMFPLWLALKERNLIRRLAILTVPVAVFLGAFLPWLGNGGLAGVIEHVFRYRSFSNAPLWHLLGMGWTPDGVKTLAFVTGLALAGVLLRRRSQMDLLLAYLLLVVCLAPGVANQYLAIASVPVAVWFGVPFAVFATMGGLFLLAHRDGLGLSGLQSLPHVLGGGGYSARSYDLLIAVLTVGTLMALMSTGSRPRGPGPDLEARSAGRRPAMP